MKVTDIKHKFVFLGQSVLRYEVPYDIFRVLNSVYEQNFINLPPANKQLVGKIKNEHSIFYDGEWENGYNHGYGKYNTGINEYEGEIKYNYYHGKGKLIKKNFDGEIEKIEEGQFEYGQFIG